jgi:hypothetical protein
MGRGRSISSKTPQLWGAYQRVGDGTVFSCTYAEMFPDDHATLWQLNFYGIVVFAVGTNFIMRKEISAE